MQCFSLNLSKIVYQIFYKLEVIQILKFQELIPLILCTAMLHPDAKERDNLLNILFNLIKKPDEEQR